MWQNIFHIFILFLVRHYCKNCCRLSFLSAIQDLLAQMLCTRLGIGHKGERELAVEPDGFVIALKLKAYETDTAY